MMVTNITYNAMMHTPTYWYWWSSKLSKLWSPNAAVKSVRNVAEAP